ncbi:unnamed protein product, partial [Nesidiocoris tenuis]
MVYHFRADFLRFRRNIQESTRGRAGKQGKCHLGRTRRTWVPVRSVVEEILTWISGEIISDHRSPPAWSEEHLWTRAIR